MSTKSTINPTIGNICYVCRAPICAGDDTKLTTLGPGINPEQQQRAREGLSYTAMTAEAHALCAEQAQL